VNARRVFGLAGDIAALQITGVRFEPRDS